MTFLYGKTKRKREKSIGIKDRGAEKMREKEGKIGIERKKKEINTKRKEIMRGYKNRSKDIVGVKKLS